MYKDKDKAREASKERMKKWRDGKKGVTLSEPIPDPDVTPFVTPDVTPYDHPDKVQCGAIQRNWDDIPAWMKRSYMRSTHKWERMLVCVPDYTRPSILSTPNDIN